MRTRRPSSSRRLFARARSFAVPLALAAIVAFAGPARAGGDFDGDGVDDVVVGIPNESLDGTPDAGAVLVLYVGHGDFPRSQFWREGADGVPGAAQPFDEFGRALGIGDFDADGFDDLAIGVPGERVSDRPEAGAVVILHGGPDGLTAARARLITKASPGIHLRPKEYENFGESLEPGDFNGDGFGDLAIGAPSAVSHGGMVHVVFGGSDGLSTDGSQPVVEPGGPVPLAFFGLILRRGDFDGDAFDDLAVGLPQAASNDLENAGQVRVFFGSPTGLALSDTALLRQSGFPGHVDAANELFGQVLESGDFDGDGFDELAISASFGSSGSVHVAFGSDGGLEPRETWTIAEFGSVPAAGDAFGRALVAGDVNDDGCVDLVIGIPGARERRGAAALLRGRPIGLVAGRIFAPRVLGGASPGDLFGIALASGDFTGDGRVDVVAGVPLDDVGGIESAGSISLLAIPRAAFSFLHQDAEDVPDFAESGDFFGLVLGR